MTEGEELFNTGQYEQAIAKYKETLSYIDRPSEVIENQLGLAYTRLEKYDLAIIHLSNSLEINDDAVTRLNRAHASILNGQCDGAIQDAQTALQQEPASNPGFHTDVSAHYILVECYVAKSENAQALQHIEVAISMAVESQYTEKQIADLENIRQALVSAIQPEPSPTATSVPTVTPVPTSSPVPTPTVAVLPTVECTPKPCNTAPAPTFAHVDWIEPPQVTADGKFTLVARVHDGHDLIIATPAPDSGRLNLHFSRGSALFGSILPVDNTPGWKWREKPTSWEADVYTYENNVLAVVAQINPAAATHPDLRMCLWRGGATRDDTYILGCTEVEQP